MENFVGDKFDKSNPNRFNRTWICKQIRADLKSAFGKGYKFSVKKSVVSNAIDIVVKEPRNCNETVIGKIFRIANAYNYDHSDGQHDNFDRNFYLHVELL